MKLVRNSTESKQQALEISYASNNLVMNLSQRELNNLRLIRETFFRASTAVFVK